MKKEIKSIQKNLISTLSENNTYCLQILPEISIGNPYIYAKEIHVFYVFYIFYIYRMSAAQAYLFDYLLFSITILALERIQW